MGCDPLKRFSTKKNQKFHQVWIFPWMVASLAASQNWKKTDEVMLMKMAGPKPPYLKSLSETVQEIM
jgi:hypothetical protein